MSEAILDTFGGSMPGESFTREFGSLPMDKPPVTADPIEAFKSTSGMLNDESTQRDICKLVKAGLSVETIVNTLSTQGVSEGMFNPDVAELIKVPLFFKIFDICHDKVKNIKLYNEPIKKEIRESDLEGMQNLLDPDNEFLETDEDKEQNELLNKIKKDLDREEGFMSNSNISGEI